MLTIIIEEVPNRVDETGLVPYWDRGEKTDGVRVLIGVMPGWYFMGSPLRILRRCGMVWVI